MNEQLQTGIWTMAAGGVIILILWLQKKGLLGKKPETPQ